MTEPRRKLPAAGARPPALLRYAALWIAVAAVVAFGLGAAIREIGGDEVPVPPVRGVEFTEAAREAHCEFRRACPGEQLEPPVDGRAAAPADPGIYEQPVDAARLGAAVRSGLVVIHHSPELEDDMVEALRTLQKAVPDGTVLTVNPSMPGYQVAVTAYRRLLGCRNIERDTIDAISLFRGRFIGSGPDR